MNRSKDSITFNFELSKQHSLMHYAVLTGSTSMIQMLIDLDEREYEEKRTKELEYQ